MSLITALLKRGRKRQHTSDDSNEEQQSTKRPRLWGGAGSLSLGFLFGRQSAPTHGNHAPHGIVDNFIGGNGHEAVDADEDDATNNQLQLDVNAHDEGGNNRADSNGAAVAAMADRDNQRTIPRAPRKRAARLAMGNHDDENHVHRPYTSEGNFGWSDGVGVTNEINNDAFNQSLDHYTQTLAITDGSSDDDRSDSESSSSSGVGSSDSSDDSDSSDSSDDESADDTTAVVEDEENTHQFYESEQSLNEVAAVQQDEEENDEEENEADTIVEDDITEQQSNEEEVTTNNDRQVVIITRHTPLLPANLNLNGHPRGIIFDGGLEAPSSEDDDDEEEDAMHIESVQPQQQQQQSAETDDEALAHALQHHYDNEQTQMAEEDAALALALQNKYSPHARESDSSTDPSRTFEFTRRSSDLGSSDVDAMDTEVHQEGIESEMDDDVDEEAETAAAEAAVDLEMEVFEDYLPRLLDAPQRPLRPANGHDPYKDESSAINLTFDDVANPSSPPPRNYFCSTCRAISFPGTFLTDGNHMCMECEELIELDEADQQMRNDEASDDEEEEDDEDAEDAPATTTSLWDALTSYNRVRVIRTQKKPFCGQVTLLGKNCMTSSHTTKEAAIIELTSRHLAEKSTVTHGTITFVDPVFDFTLEELTQHLEADLGVMKRFPNDFPSHGLGEENEMNQLLREVAESLRGVFPANWKTNSSNRFVLDNIAECLERIADGDEESPEFPWLTGPTQGIVFPSIDDLRADMTQVRDELDGPNHNAVINILLRLEPGSNCFASESTKDGNWGPPYRYTGSKLQCPQKACAIHTVESFFHGYQAYDRFIRFIPAEYRDNPEALPFEGKQDVIKRFYRSMGITFVPCFLKPMEDFSVDAAVEEVEALQVAINPLLDRENSRIIRELRILEDHQSLEEQQLEDYLARVIGYCGPLFEFIHKEQHQGAPSMTLVQFREKFTELVQKIHGLEDVTADSFPALTSINWNNVNVNSNSNQNQSRLRSLASLKVQLISALTPLSRRFSDGNTVGPGQCQHPTCTRSIVDYAGSSMQLDHVTNNDKKGDPTIVARKADDALINEMKENGFRNDCGHHHDHGDKKREWEPSILKHIKLIPRPVPNRDGGSSFRELLLDNQTLCIKLGIFAALTYCHGWNGHSAPSYGNFDTLRVVVYDLFDLLVDDYMILDFYQFNVTKCRNWYIRECVRYIIQDLCGTCFAATFPGTAEGKRKLEENEEMSECDYACRVGDFDLRNMAVLERQGNEADHNDPTKKRKSVTKCANIYEMIDEACHAPYHCYFCHKRRTAKQHPNSRCNRDYTV